jgi:Leucine-rich repeat (LRR) protein
MYEGQSQKGLANSPRWTGCECVDSMIRYICNVSICRTRALTSNRLSGTIPASIGDLTTLKFLSFENNKLNGTIPPSIGRLQHLTEL